MNQVLQLPTPKANISPIGLQFTGELTLDEWKSLAPALGQAARSVAFVIGDWLVYGDSLFGTDGPPTRRVAAVLYEYATKHTGIDIPTLQNFAYVSRNVPYPLRTEQLSWEHHRLLAKLPEPEQASWIQTCISENQSGQRMSTRRLRKSIHLGRIATPQDMEPDVADQGVENHIPYVNRLALWWKRMQADQFLRTSTYEQRQSLKRDLEPIVTIYNQLNS
jgi:hypothetical protein